MEDQSDFPLVIINSKPKEMNIIAFKLALWANNVWTQGLLKNSQEEETWNVIEG